MCSGGFNWFEEENKISLTPLTAKIKQLKKNFIVLARPFETN